MDQPSQPEPVEPSAAAQSAPPQIFSRARRGFESVQIQPYDFKRPERIGKEQMRSLLQIHETFARSLGASLSGLLQTIVTAKVSQTEQSTYSAFTGALPNPTCFNLISSSGLTGQLCLEVSPLVVYPILDRLLGGSSQGLVLPRREMTAIEMRLMKMVVHRALGALHEAWSTVESMEFRLDQMTTSPQISQIVPPNEVVVVVGLEIRMGEHTGTMSLGIPYKVLEPVIDELGTETWAQASAEPADGRHADAIADHLIEAPLQLTGVLARTTITLADLTRLEVGDVILTGKPAGAPAVLEVIDRPKFLAGIGRYRGARALKIVGPAKPGDPPPEGPRAVNAGPP